MGIITFEQKFVQINNKGELSLINSEKTATQFDNRAEAEKKLKSLNLNKALFPFGKFDYIPI